MLSPLVFPAVPQPELLPAIVDARPLRSAAALRRQVEAALAARIPAALTVTPKATPERVATGIPAIDALTGGLPRGALSEFCGPASSGRTSVMLAALAQATGRAECCCIVDTSDAFDLQSAAAAGVDLERLLWVRCGVRANRGTEKKTMRFEPAQRTRSSDAQWREAKRNARRAMFNVLEQALKVTDLLLHGGGFGMIAIDIANVPTTAARRVPLTSWFRFRRAVENTPTVLLLVEQAPSARTCASLVVELSASGLQNVDGPSHARLLDGLQVRAEALRTPERKQPTSTAREFATTAQWTVG